MGTRPPLSSSSPSSSTPPPPVVTPTTRLCIKNIPITHTEDKLRQWLKGVEMTDVKVLRTKDGRSRKMAFLGFATQSVADDILRKYNNTYIQTGKVSLEYAMPQNVAKQVSRPWSVHSEGSSRHDAIHAPASSSLPASHTDTNKPSTHTPRTNARVSKWSMMGMSSERIAQLEHDVKFQEYLGVMRSRSKNKFWSNHDADITQQDVDTTRDEKGYMTYEEYVKQQKEERKKDGKKKADDESDDESGDDDDYFKNPMLDTTSTPAAAKSSSSAKIAAAAAGSDSKKAGAAGKMTDDEYMKSKMKQSFSDSDDDSDSDSEDSGEDASSISKTSTTAHAAATTDEEMDEDDEEEKKDSSADVKVVTVVSDEPIEESGRLFIRNLSYTCTSQHLEECFKAVGKIVEVHVPVGDDGRNKGFGYVTYMFPHDARRAMSVLDKTVLLGRVLHILPSHPKIAAKSDMQMYEQMSEDDRKKMGYKKRKEMDMKAMTHKSDNWNTLFLRSDTVASSAASSMGVGKHDILDIEGESMAARLSLAETQIVAETKKFLRDNGVDVSVFTGSRSNTSRSDCIILCKNIPFDTDVDEMKRMFCKYGQLVDCVMPPSRALAIIHFSSPTCAKTAFTSLAYKKFKHVPIYLEWAPTGTMSSDGKMEEKERVAVETKKTDAIAMSSSTSASDDASDSTTVYVKNLSFSTTEEKLKQCMLQIGSVRSVTIAKKKNTKAKAADGITDAPSFLSMGYGFVEYATAAHARLAAASSNAISLDGHMLEIKISSRGVKRKDADSKSDAASDIPSTKLLVKNVPFETTSSDLRQLFGAFGQIQRLRLPKKYDGGHRGFAFIDFVTKAEAKHAYDSVGSTHMYGRHLVLEWAADEDSLEKIREKTVEKYASQQAGAAPHKKKKVQHQDDKDEAFSSQFM